MSTETYRRKIFEQSFDQNNADAWLRTYRQSYSQWLDSTDKTAFEAVLMELTIRKLPRWLETYMRNLNPDNFEELREAIVRYLGSQKRDDTSTKRTDRPEKSRTQMSDTPNRNREPEPRRLEMRDRKDATLFPFRDPRQMECFRCGKKGAYQKRWCRVKLEGTNLVVAHMEAKNLPRWTCSVNLVVAHMEAKNLPRRTCSVNLVVAHMEAKNLPRWTCSVNLVVAHMEAKNLPRWTCSVNLVVAHMEAKNLPRWTCSVNLVVAHMEAKNLPRWTCSVNLVVAHMEAKNLPRWTCSVNLVVAHMEAKNLPRWTCSVNLVVAHMEAKNLPRWTRPVKIKNRPVLVPLDTGCTKSMVHPRCVQESDHLPWKIPYKTATSTKTYFPAARVTLQIEGTDTRVGGRSIPPHLCRHFARARRSPLQEVAEGEEEESSMKPETKSLSEETKEETRIQTSLVTTRAQLDRQHLQDQQEQKEQEEDGQHLQVYRNKKSRKRMSLLYTQWILR